MNINMFEHYNPPSIEVLSDRPLPELQKARDLFLSAIASKQSTGRAAAIEAAREIIKTFDLHFSDFSFLKKATKEALPHKLEPKYRDPATGATWSGRGITPFWIAGQDKTKFLIQV